MSPIPKFRTVFIGNRPNILRVLETHKNIDLVLCFVSDTDMVKFPNRTVVKKISTDQKAEVLQSLDDTTFDLLVSAGCPFKIPVNDVPERRVYVNSHPSALPKGRGHHPINESLISEHQTAGSTLHYISATFDAGDIIHQETFQLTEDVDAQLLYGFIFEFEAEVFTKGLQKLLDHNLNYCGCPQIGPSTYYTRKQEDRYSDLKTEPTKIYLAKVRSFSSKKQGAITELINKKIVVFHAELVTNSFLIERYKRSLPGTQLLDYHSEILLIRTVDGLVKINDWSDYDENS